MLQIFGMNNRTIAYLLVLRLLFAAPQATTNYFKFRMAVTPRTVATAGWGVVR